MVISLSFQANILDIFIKDISGHAVIIISYRY